MVVQMKEKVVDEGMRKPRGLLNKPEPRPPPNPEIARFVASAIREPRGFLPQPS